VKPATVNARRGNWGGSAGGGGYDYQAEVWAIVAAKILAGQSLNWLEGPRDPVPVSVRMETGTGGDDLRVVLRDGASIEVQAKRGLTRGAKLWDALVGILRRVQADPHSYGAIVTTTSASRPVRVHLPQDLIRVGQGLHEDLHDIGQELVGVLQQSGITDLSACSRVRIIVRDLHPGSEGEEATLSVLRGVIADGEMARAARGVLVSDGHDMIKLRGRRDAASLAGVLTQVGIALSRCAENELVLREAYAEWCVQANDRIWIPTLKVALPMSKGWVRLRALSPASSKPDSESLAGEMRRYHEWYRLRQTAEGSEYVDIASAATANRLLVVIGGPGAGKSTLLRRLAWDWSARGRLVLRAPLRVVRARMRKGETFDEAILASAAEGFSPVNDVLMRILSRVSTLLADGLDETGTDRAAMADCIRKWALAGRDRHVVVTTRPVGHEPAWFEAWRHLALTPLTTKDVEALAKEVFVLLYEHDPSRAEHEGERFIADVRKSRSAAMAARSPQLLGFMIALHTNGCDIGGRRFHLFQNMMELIRRHTPRDRVLRHQVDRPVADFAAQCLGWQVVNDPVLTKNEAVDRVGHELASESSMTLLAGRQAASKTISFWKERGMLEELSAGGTILLTFVHMGFAEFAAASYLARMPEAEFAEWIRTNRTTPVYRDAIVLIDGTERMALTIRLLLEDDDPHDPVSTAGLMAADVLAEALVPPEPLAGEVAATLLTRVNSRVPMVAYEAGEKLTLLVPICPGVIGPAVHDLSTSDQPRTRDVACTLALICGPEYVDTGALVGALRARSQPPDRRGYHRRGAFVRPLTNHLFLRGVKYLLHQDAGPTYAELIRDIYTAGGYSLDSRIALRPMVVDALGYQEVTALDKKLFKWLTTDVLEHFAADAERTRAAEKALMEAVAKAAEGLVRDGLRDVSIRQGSCLSALGQVLHINESPMADIYVLRTRPSEDALIEVVRGAMLVAALHPKDVFTEARTMLQSISKSDAPLIAWLGDLEPGGSEAYVDWALAREGSVRLDPLLRAVRHPSCFVCRFAVLLLVNCFDREAVSGDLREALMDASGYALAIIAEVAADVWGEEACGVVLDRLETGLSDDCAPLVRALGSVCGHSTTDRTEPLLREALQSDSPELVTEAIHSIEQLRLNTRLEPVVKATFQRWLQQGRQDSVQGLATITWPAPMAALFTHLIAAGKLSFEEIRNAARAPRGDLRQLATPLLCKRLAEDDELLQRALRDVASADLPVDVVSELSRSHPAACNRHCGSVLRLLDSESSSVRGACVAALGRGWAPYDLAERTLRALLDDADPGIRDAATRALRQLGHQHSASRCQSR